MRSLPGLAAEVIVVNDGSTDSTAEIVKEFARRDPIVHLLENPSNRGKGFSVRNGILAGRGDIVMFTDADLSVAHRGGGEAFCGD